jgi:HAMP domain-containing protein
VGLKTEFFSSLPDLLDQLRCQPRGRLTDTLQHEVDLITFRLVTLAANRDVVLATKKSSLGVRHFGNARAGDSIRTFTAENPLIAAMYLMDADAALVDTAPSVLQQVEPTPVQGELKALLAGKVADAAAQYALMEFQDEAFLVKIFEAMGKEGKTPVVRRTPSAYGLAILVPLVLDVADQIQGALVAILPLEYLAASAFSQVESPASLAFLHGGRPIIAQMPANTTSSADRIIASETPLRIGKDIGYILRLSEPAAARFADVNKTLLTLAVSILGGVAVLIVVAYVVAQWLVSPLATLNDVVNAYAAGEYDAAPRKVRFREFESFVTTLKNMGATLLAQLTELRRARMEATMQQMEAATRTIANKLAVLHDRAADITTVISTITKVAN